MKLLPTIVSLLPKRVSVFLFANVSCLLVCGFGLALFGRLHNAAAAEQIPAESFDGVWQSVSETALPNTRKVQTPSAQAHTVKLSLSVLAATLANAPEANDKAPQQSGTLMSLPLPDGSFARVRIEASSVLEPMLAWRYPEIKSYRAIGVDDPTLTARFDWTPLGFHALVLSSSRASTILPVSQDDPLTYAVVDAGNTAELGQDFACEVFELPENEMQQFRQARMAALQTNVGASLRTYRLALAASWEYTNAFGGGTVAGTVASFNTWLNSLNAIYERELSLRLVLVDDADVIFSADRGFTASNDPFTNGSTVTMLSQVRPILRDRVGAANYDIGHALGTGGGGVAYLGVVCNNSNIGNDGRGPAKGGAVSLVSGALGNHAGINVMAHEIGHQFGAYHSFNSGVGSCGSNRSANSAVEPGSGTTIMSYAGLCGTENLAAQSELRFHALSFAQITAYLASSAACATVSSTGNSAPTVDGGADYTIPRQTPFELTATGSDADEGDAARLTYAWDETDIAYGYSNPAYNDANDGANTTRPLFRSYAPTAAAARVFPKLDYILYYANTPPETLNGYRTAEFLPSIARTLNFRVVARDQRGGVTDDQVQLTVSGVAGPFRVTAPNAATTWSGDAPQTVIWSVNNTQTLAANVRILLSTDGGASFPHVLADSTPNDGSASVTLPGGVATSVARIKAQAVGNIFFDISDANFTITAGGGTTTPCPTVSGINPTNTQVGNIVTISGANLANVTAVKFANNVAAQFTINSATQITAIVPTGAASGALTLSQAGCADLPTPALTISSAPPACAAITINPVSLPGGVLNVAYHQTLTQSGALAPVTWSLASGTLPVGLHLAATGVLSGTPSQTGSFNFTVRVTGGNGCAETKAYSVTIAACPATGCTNNTAAGSLTANPNPIQVCDGTGLGVTTLTWTTTNVSAVQIRLGSATGEILYEGTAVNASGQTGKWVTNGMSFFLVNAATGATLASTNVAVTNAGCSSGGNGTTTFSIAPDPIVVCDGTGLGVATFTWSTLSANSVVIRRGTQNGPVIALGRSKGQTTTGKWVTDGTRFFLLRQIDETLLATVTARVTSTGCALTANQPSHAFFVQASRGISSRDTAIRRSVRGR